MIEIEIIRAKCYYNFYYIFTKILKNTFDIDKIETYAWKEKDGFIIKIRDMIVRIIFCLIMVRTDSSDPIFISDQSEDLKHQLYKDINVHFKDYNSKNIDLNHFSLDLYEIIIYAFKEYSNIIKNAIVKKDNIVTITKINDKQYNIIYQSDSINSDLPDDPFVKTERGKIILNYYSNSDYLDPNKYSINYVFADYFRYQYLYANTQTLAYRYNTDKKEAIECFSTPFNRFSFYFCSGFPDLEKYLGSEGDFFEIIKKAIKNEYTYPVNTLRINPPFDEITCDNTSELVLRLLEVSKTKYKISLILPDWKDFRATEILLKSNFLIKSERYKKGELYFKNFFTNEEIAPCPIIIIFLEN